jgi:hypothetical protein
VEEMITKAAKKGQMPSQIGVLLRDQHGIPLVKSVTGSKIPASSRHMVRIRSSFDSLVSSGGA